MSEWKEKIALRRSVQSPSVSRESAPSNLNSQKIMTHPQHQSPVNIVTGNSSNGIIRPESVSMMLQQRIVPNVRSENITDKKRISMNELSDHSGMGYHGINTNNYMSHMNAAGQHYLAVQQQQQQRNMHNNNLCNSGLVRSTASMSNMPAYDCNILTGRNNITNNNNIPVAKCNQNVMSLLQVQNALRRQLEQLTEQNIQLTSLNANIRSDLDQAMEENRHMTKMQRLRNQQLQNQTAEYESLQKKFDQLLKENINDADDNPGKIDSKDGKFSEKNECKLKVRLLKFRNQELEAENNTLKGSVQELKEINKDLNHRVEELAAIFEGAGSLLFKDKKKGVKDDAVAFSKRSNDDTEKPVSQKQELGRSIDASPPSLKHQVTNEHVKLALPTLKRQETNDIPKKEPKCGSDASPPSLKHQVTNEHVKLALPTLKRQEINDIVSLHCLPSNNSFSMSSHASKNVAPQASNESDEQALPSELNRQVTNDIPLKIPSKLSSTILNDDGKNNPPTNINQVTVEDRNSCDNLDRSSPQNDTFRKFSEGRDREQTSGSLLFMSMPKADNAANIDRNHINMEMYRKYKGDLLAEKSKLSVIKNPKTNGSDDTDENYLARMDKTFSVSDAQSTFINFRNVMASARNDNPVHNRISSFSSTSASIIPPWQMSQRQGLKKENSSEVNNLNQKEKPTRDDGPSTLPLPSKKSGNDFFSRKGTISSNYNERPQSIDSDKNKESLYQRKHKSGESSSEVVGGTDAVTEMDCDLKDEDEQSSDDEKSRPIPPIASSAPPTNVMRELLSSHVKNADATTLDTLTRQLIEMNDKNAYQFSSLLTDKKEQHTSTNFTDQQFQFVSLRSTSTSDEQYAHNYCDSSQSDSANPPDQQASSISPPLTTAVGDITSKKKHNGAIVSKKESDIQGKESNNNDDDETKKQKRRRGRPRRDKSEGWPKRPLSAYNLFFREQRVKILEQLTDGEFVKDEDLLARDPEEMTNKRKRGRPLKTNKRRKRAPPHGIITFEELGKKISKNWKNASSEVKVQYQNRANEYMKIYQDELVLFLRRKARKLDNNGNSIKGSKEGNSESNTDSGSSDDSSSS